MDRVNKAPGDRSMQPSTVAAMQGDFRDLSSHCIREYELIHQISRGGCGEVWVARHSHLRTECALKVVFDHAGAVEEAAIRLYKENVRIEDYACLVPIEHFGLTEEGRRYYVMPLADDVAGPKVLRAPARYRPETLAARLISHGRLPLDELLEIADQLLLALTRLHGYGLVHRDVKPLNVLRVQERWRLGDFGLMALRSRLHAEPDTESGTYWYRPPGERADFPMDVYSLGKTLFILATEATPPCRERDPDPCAAFLAGTLPLTRDDARAEPLGTILVRACATDPAERISLEEMRRAISRLVCRTTWVQLTLPGNFDSFTEGERREWLAKIEALGVVVLANRVARGSILLQLQLTPAQADYLRAAVKAGALAACGVTEATEVDLGQEAQVAAGTASVRQETLVVARAAVTGGPEVSIGRTGRSPVPKSAARKWWTIGVGMAASVLLLGLAGLWHAGVFKVKAKEEAILVIEVNEADAEVWVDGERATVTWADDGKKAEIHVKSGTHQVKVTKDGFASFGGIVELNDADRKDLTVRLSHEGSSSLLLPNGFVSLFNGKDLAGWKRHSSQSGNWRVENGILVGQSPSTSVLYTVRGDYKDFHLRLEGRIKVGGKSEVQFRSPDGLTGYAVIINRANPGPGEAMSLELDDNGEGRTVSLRRASLPASGPWFIVDVIARDNDLVIMVNGVRVMEYSDAQRRFSQGHIALVADQQIAGEFRKIEIKELPLQGR
jgi:Domain of Unknown Function (DUF1080)/Protein kinase domain